MTTREPRDSIASVYERRARRAALDAARCDSRRRRKLEQALFVQFEPLPDALDAAGVDPSQVRWTAEHLTRRECVTEAAGGATRLVLETRSGRRLETVVLRYPNRRSTVCVSSQVGCAARCRFCATGRLRDVADLSSDEILDQVVHAGRLLRDEERRPTNVVFMGMGEPLWNAPAVIDALEVLRDEFAIAERRLLVSTVGVPERMIGLARRLPRVELALSLHAARDEVRRRLMPTAHAVSVDRLRDTLVEVESIRSRDVMLEFVLLDGVNDGATDLDALLRFVDGLRVHVNLIPWNSVPEIQLAPSPVATRERWRDALKQRGVKATLRRSLGGDIAAACGQLASQA